MGRWDDGRGELWRTTGACTCMEWWGCTADLEIWWYTRSRRFRVGVHGRIAVLHLRFFFIFTFHRRHTVQTSELLVHFFFLQIIAMDSLLFSPLARWHLIDHGTYLVYRDTGTGSSLITRADSGWRTKGRGCLYMYTSSREVLRIYVHLLSTVIDMCVGRCLLPRICRASRASRGC